MKNIAIIIDCWAGHYDPPESLPWNHDLLHRNIISLISVNQSIDTVILATHDISPDEFNTNNLWYINFKKFNYSKAFTNPIVQHELAGGIQYPDMPTTDYRGNTTDFQTEQRTCICLLHQYWPDKFQIAAFHPHQLTLAGIENVYFFGEAWDACVRNRAIGYAWWIRHTDTNLFVYRNGVRVDTYDIDTNHWNLVPRPQKNKKWDRSNLRFIENELYKFDRNFTKFY